MTRYMERWEWERIKLGLPLTSRDDPPGLPVPKRAIFDLADGAAILCEWPTEAKEPKQDHVILMLGGAATVRMSQDKALELISIVAEALRR